MDKFDNLLSDINGIVGDKAIAEKIVKMCENKEIVFHYISDLYKHNYDRMFEIYSAIVKNTADDRTLALFCRYIRKYTDDFISLKNHTKPDKINTCLREVAENIYAYGEQAQYFFVQTLEYLWAFGYEDLELIIVDLYKQINCDDLYSYTAKYVSKKMSCVYVADDDNIFSVFKECRDVKKALEDGKYKHLMGLCRYYLGIAEIYKERLCRRDDELEAFKNVDFKGYMAKSAAYGCELAITFLQHRGLKLRNSETPRKSGFNRFYQLF